jgi:hypothetical protein
MSNEGTPAAPANATEAQAAKPAAPAPAAAAPQPAPAALTVSVVPADGGVVAGSPMTIEVTKPGVAGNTPFLDAAADWGDGTHGDHLRLFRSGDRLVGRTSHAYAKPGKYAIRVEDQLFARGELAVTCGEAKA